MFTTTTSRRARVHQRHRGIPMAVFSLLIISSSVAWSQPAPQISLTSLDRYRERELAATISFWRGIQLKRGDGAQVELGRFGGAYEQVFKGSPGALDSMRTYRRLKISGTVLQVAALATVLTQTALMASGKLSTDDSLFYGLLAGGAGLGLTGSVVMQGANAYLSDAVQQYNRDLLQILDRRADAGGRGARFSVAYGGKF